MMNANDVWALASELTAKRPFSPPSADNIVYSPALPHAAISDDAASRIEKRSGRQCVDRREERDQAQASWRATRQWASTSTRAGRPRRMRPNARAPMTPGSV